MRSLFLLFTLGFIFISCNSDDGFGGQLSKPIGQCHFLFDANGSPIGTLGECTDQAFWSTSGINDFERGFFDFQDTVPTNDNFIELENLLIGVYPNPAIVDGQLFFFVFGDEDPGNSTKLRIALVDELNQRLLAGGIRFEAGFNNLVLNLDGLPKGQSYRLYYQLLANSESPYHEGFGDFFVCDDPLNFDGCW